MYITNLLFTGYSDDLVEVEYNGTKLTVVDEDSTREVESPEIQREEFNTDGAEFLVTSSEYAVLVTALYTHQGTWAFGVAQDSDKNPLPTGITIQQSQETDYSVVLSLPFHFAKEITVTKL